MDIVTKYITPDDFKDYFGIDLVEEYREEANPSNSANAFIKRIEDRIATYIDANFYRQVDKEYPNFTDYQKEHYSKALLEQAIYVFKNGDISVDSGYDYDTGEKASNRTLLKKSIAPNCRQNLILCGLWCVQLHNLRHGGGIL